MDICEPSDKVCERWMDICYFLDLVCEPSDKVCECLFLPLPKSKESYRRASRAYISEEVLLELSHHLGERAYGKQLQTNILFSCLTS